jgi:hypothetical protein
MSANWVGYHLQCLAYALQDEPVITLSKKPMSFGLNILDKHEEKSYWNIYRAMLRGARAAKTPFVAVVEDDTLYSPAHFKEFRPKLDEVSYNRSRWSLFSWENKPMYCVRQRVSNCSLIASRGLLIEALEEREAKYPNGNDYVGEVGRPIVERRLGVTPRKMVEWYSTVPIIQLNHPHGIDETQQRKWKKHGQLKAYDIPYWGKAEDIVRIYNGS